MAEYFIRKEFNIAVSKAQGYAKMQANAEKLLAEGVTDLIITDMSPTPEMLQWSLANFNSVTLYDHHISSENYLGLSQVNSKYQHNYSSKLCGAAVVTQSLKIKMDARERALLKYTNVYDLWKENSKPEDWELAHRLNDLFWYYTDLEFWGFLPILDTIDILNLTEEQEDICTDLVNQRKQSVEDSVATMFNTGSIVTLLPDSNAVNYVSWYTDYDQFENDHCGVFYNLTINDDGNVKCSVRINSSLSDYDANYILQKHVNDKIISNLGGHTHAAGIEFNTNVIEDVIDYLEILDKELHEEYR